MTTSKTPPQPTGTQQPEPPQLLDDDRKRLMAALIEFTALVRRPEPRDDRSGGGLALGRIMRRHGLEQRHAGALLTISLYGPMTITQLAQRHHVTLKTASLMAVELEQAGLIRRREDPTDRRRTIVTVAKSKERAIREGLNSRAVHLQRALDRLTPQQRDGLITGLEILAEEMNRTRS